MKKKLDLEIFCIVCKKDYNRGGHEVYFEISSMMSLRQWVREPRSKLNRDRFKNQYLNQIFKEVQHNNYLRNQSPTRHSKSSVDSSFKIAKIVVTPYKR